jgi:hypothetical protein
MSKKYKGKTCVYCCTPNASQTADHVIARQFLLERRRDNLPKVPACLACNNEKSALEHYLATVLPFGGTHPDAGETLQSMLPGRLEKNRKLHLQLAQGMEQRYSSPAGAPWVPTLTLPFDGASLTKLYEFIARGLAFAHWNLLLPPETCLVRATFIRDDMPMFQQLLERNANRRVQIALGNGVFVYEGAQAAQPPELTIWKMSLAGAQFLTDQAGQTATAAYVLTGPRGMRAAVDIVRILDRGVPSPVPQG